MENEHRIVFASGVRCSLLVDRPQGANNCIYPNSEVPCSGCKIAIAIQTYDSEKDKASEVKDSIN